MKFEVKIWGEDAAELGEMLDKLKVLLHKTLEADTRETYMRAGGGSRGFEIRPEPVPDGRPDVILSATGWNEDNAGLWHYFTGHRSECGKMWIGGGLSVRTTAQAGNCQTCRRSLERRPKRIGS